MSRSLIAEDFHAGICIACQACEILVHSQAGEGNETAKSDWPREKSNRGVQACRPAIPVGATTPTEPFSKPEITLKINRAANSEVPSLPSQRVPANSPSVVQVIGTAGCPRVAVCVAANAACNCPARYILRTMKVVTFTKEVDYVPYGPN
jgi:hypothetical protein